LESNIVFYLLGALASMSFISSNYALTRPWILIFQTMGSLFVSTQFILIDVWSVAIVNSVFILRNLVLYSRELYLNKSKNTPVKKEELKWGVFFMSILIPIYLFSNPLTYSTFVSYESTLLWGLPFLAGIANIVAIAQPKLINLKFFILISVSSWAIFDIITEAWTTLIGDLFSAVACIVAIYRIKKVKAKTD